MYQLFITLGRRQAPSLHNHKFSSKNKRNVNRWLYLRLCVCKTLFCEVLSCVLLAEFDYYIRKEASPFLTKTINSLLKKRNVNRWLYLRLCVCKIPFCAILISSTPCPLKGGTDKE